MLWGNGEKISHFIDSTIGYAELAQPIIFVGEDGTENDELVRHIYLNSSMKDSLLTLIDCAKLRSSEWEYLFENYNSPFYKTKGSIYLQNINHLSLDRINRMLTFFENTNIFRRCKILLGFQEGSFKEQKIQIQFSNYLEPYIMIRIPPLREHPEDISSISNLYTNELNIKYGKQVIGLGEDALETLENYAWPQNITQLKQILQSAVLNATSSYLSLSDIDSIMRERQTINLLNTSSVINLNVTLREIEKQIAEYILKQENFNQTKTAKKLNISRTTLWRLLNE